MSRQEAAGQYREALRAGQRAYKNAAARGEYPYLPVLDDLLEDTPVAGQVYLGLMEIPAEQIAGTKSRGRKDAFANNFMPLLSEQSEFADKWIHLCTAHLSPEGIREPVKCCEYLGKFYVQEGNKRVSVLKSYGAATIPGYVTRLLPQPSRDPAIRRYCEFLQAYDCTKLYQVSFSQSGSFPKLQAALGNEADYVWTEEDRRRFLSGYSQFCKVFFALGGDKLDITPADAMLVWLKVYPYAALHITTAAGLESSVRSVWQDIKMVDSPMPIAVRTDPEAKEQGLLGRLKSAVFHTHMQVAVVNEYHPERSAWVRGHVLGAEKMQETLGDQITVHVYNGVGRGAGAEAAMEEAVAAGAQVIFTTTATLISACRKIAAKYPHVRVLNCSVSMPYAGVRSYYSRIYEGKFISGAIAGALSESDEIGYVANYPIFGVPAAINAFALGARLTNPRARVKLRWSCVPGNPVRELAEQGIEYISTMDIPTPDRFRGRRGLCRVQGDGSVQLLASPFWDWGKFYTKILENILRGGWDVGGKQPDRAVNYWWGMSGGVIGMRYDDELPEGVRTLAQMLQQGLEDGSLQVFRREMRSRDGEVRSSGETPLSTEEILAMDWLCDIVDGSFPAFQELRPGARELVRLQGIYRDSIPPEKEGVLL